MLAYLNMTSRVSLGNVLLNNISGYKVTENVLEMSNTAEITIPRNYKKMAEKSILEQFKVGDKVKIESGYDGKYDVEFTGYISEIETDFPLIIHCEDESYILRQTKFIKAYKSATLKQILADIIPASILWDAPAVNIGKYQIDKASAYTVLSDLVKNYGLYSRMSNGHLKVGLAYDFVDKSKNHIYVIGGNIKKNDLKYKRTQDFKLRFKAVATNPNGKKTTVTVGSKETDASERTLNFAGPMTEAQLKEKATGVMAKLVYDGYSGSITGFGFPRTHAGDALVIKDKYEPERAGTYLIEKVEITYNESDGYQRVNTLSYKI
jgi:hypothetical protein